MGSAAAHSDTSISLPTATQKAGNSIWSVKMLTPSATDTNKIVVSSERKSPAASQGHSAVNHATQEEFIRMYV